MAGNPLDINVSGKNQSQLGSLLKWLAYVLPIDNLQEELGTSLATAWRIMRVDEASAGAIITLSRWLEEFGIQIPSYQLQSLGSIPADNVPLLAKPDSPWRLTAMQIIGQVRAQHEKKEVPDGQ